MSKLKKILPIALLLVLLLCCGISASAEVVSGDCGAEGNNVTYTLDMGTGLLEISGTGEMANYSYASQVPWYSYREFIKTVTISEGVTSIGDYSFYWRTNLQSVELPESLISLGDYSFAWCENLQSIELPEGVTSIGDSAFYQCRSLESITLPDSVTSIGEGAFDYCYSLTKVYYNGSTADWLRISIGIQNESLTDAQIIFDETNSVSGLCSAEGYNIIYVLDTDTGALEISGTGEMADYSHGSRVPWYSYRELIKTVTVSEGVTGIGDYSFAWCENLQSVELPEGVTNIGRYAFCTCKSLQSINIPDGVRYIGDDTFFECSSLESVTLPESVTGLGNYAFYYCGSLQGIYIPENVTSIGDRAFSFCKQLTAINVDENNVSYSSLDGVLFDKEKTTLIAYPVGKEDISSYTIPDSVTSIGIDAFKANDSLQSINIPETVSSIDETAFEDCRQLTAINVDENNAFYSSLDGILFDKEKTTIVRYPCCKKDTSSYTIPDRDCDKIGLNQ